MLAISVFHAIRDAIASSSAPNAPQELTAPATPEAVLRALGLIDQKALA
jgi:xanthine dehydrogenase large subunit